MKNQWLFFKTFAEKLWSDWDIDVWSFQRERHKVLISLADSTKADFNIELGLNQILNI